MGNMQYPTTLDIDEYFEEIEYEKECKFAKPGNILLQLDPPAVTNKGKEIDKVLIIYGYGSVGFEPYKGFPKESKITYTWKPKSHMKDFEVINRPGKGEVKVARGQGIGLFISDIHKFYMKLIYDEKTAVGIKPVVYCLWNHTDHSRANLTRSLFLGYDVLFLNNKFNHLMEPLDDQDSHETTILFKDLQKYAHYDHHHTRKRKRDPNSDQEEHNRVKKKLKKK